MGYVHSYGLTKKIKEIPTEALTKIRKTVESHKDILRLEFDKDQAPVITTQEIRFNGYKDKGYESFYFSVDTLKYFCKTNEKDYDKAVTKILLILFHYIPEFKLSSDGFWIYKSQADEFTKSGKVDLSDYWNEAISYMKKQYNIEFEWSLTTSTSDNYEYYCMNIHRKIIRDEKKSKTKLSNIKAKYTKEEKSEYFKKKLQNLKDSIEDKIDDFLENSEELKNFIQFKKKHFKTYSLRNSILIYNQFPKASYVAGFKKWQELGYSIKSGSKAIKILIPLIKKENSENNKEKEIPYGFKAVNIFDISQVVPGPDAQKIPSINLNVHLTENMNYSEEILFEACKLFISSHCKLNIINDNSLNNCLGMTNGKEIFVLNTFKPIDMAAVMIHEFAHFFNHYKENRNELTLNQKETEAEITSIIFSCYFNLNYENRFKYLAMYKKSRDLNNCFLTALDTFNYILGGTDGTNGLESILERLNSEVIGDY